MNRAESGAIRLPRPAGPDTPVTWPVTLATDTGDLVRYGGCGERATAARRSATTSPNSCWRGQIRDWGSGTLRTLGPIGQMTFNSSHGIVPYRARAGARCPNAVIRCV